MSNIPNQPSASTIARNPHLYGKPCNELPQTVISAQKVSSKPRIRQSSKPLMNKLESEFFKVLEAKYPGKSFDIQARKYNIANGVWLMPDFVGHVHPGDGAIQETAWEVKGPHAWEDSLIKLKVAARVWPHVEWRLNWKVDGQWREQIVLP